MKLVNNLLLAGPLPDSPWFSNFPHSKASSLEALMGHSSLFYLTLSFISLISLSLLVCWCCASHPCDLYQGCCPPRCKYTSHCAGSVHRVSSPIMCVGLLAEDGKNEMRVILLLTLPLCWRFSNMVGWSQWWAWHWIRLILFIFFIILTQLWKGSWSPNYPSKGFCCWCPFSWFLQQWPFSCSTVRNWLILSPVLCGLSSLCMENIRSCVDTVLFWVCR